MMLQPGSVLAIFSAVVFLLQGESQGGLITRGCKKDIFIQIRKGAVMMGVNSTSHQQLNFGQCKKKCQDETGFHCFGVEYHVPTRVCRLMKKGLGSQTGWRPSPLWFHFDRFCLQVKAYTRIGNLLGPIAVKMGSADFMVCGTNTWTDNAARATCKAFGMQEGVAISQRCKMPVNLALLRPENRTFHKISCSGNEINLLHCKGELDGATPCPGDHYASALCLPQQLKQGNDEFNVRLQHYANTTTNWGMVQMRNQGYWAGVCEINVPTAKAVCKQLGHNGGVPLFVSRWKKPTADFGLRGAPFNIRKVICPQGSNHLRECHLEETCTRTPFCHTNGFAHVLCSKNSAFDGKIRLGGGTSRAGRVEYRFDGVWGTILANDNWTPVEATVVCKELGYKYGIVQVMRTTLSSPVWMSDVYCQGTEDKLIECRLARGWKNPHPLSLADRKDAGVICQDVIKYRLADGSSPNKGRVELALQGTAVWGSACNALWTDQAATVLCKKLGYPRGGKTLSGTPFGRGSGPILLNEVQCTGTENDLMACKHLPFGAHNCTHYQDVTVECFDANSQGPAVSVPQNTDFFFSKKPRNVTTEIGKSLIILQCKTNQRATITWYKNGFQIDTQGTGYQLYRGGVLVINKIQRTHAGLYTCEARKLGNEEAVIRAYATVQIPNIGADECAQFLEEIPQNATTRVGRDVLFKCYAEHAVNITWLKDGAVVTNDGRREILVNGFLKIPRVTQQDAGKYVCKARVRDVDDSICETEAGATLTVFTQLKQVCGQATVNQPRISSEENRGYVVGGKEALAGSAPWQVMIIFRAVQWEPACGGVIVHESLIVTAAHCLHSTRFPVDSEADIKIKVGKHSRMREDETEVTHIVDEILEHPDYDRNTYDNDIALLHLANPITFNDYVRPTCIGEASRLVRLLRPGQFGTLTGWGHLNNLEQLPNALNEVRLPVVVDSTCRASTRYPFTDNMFCAGSGQELQGDSCKGDSGGPFSMKDSTDNRWYLCGIVSWGSTEGCARQGEYGFYTKVEKYVNWLKSFIALED